MLDRNMKIFVGLGIHCRHWHVTVMTVDVELFSGSIPGNWESLEKLLMRYHGYQISTVYEAGYFGFWLHDGLLAWGADCLVTPPSLLPVESGNRVKTDRRDSHKLARLLSKGMLRGVWVPSIQERYHRQVARRRRQLLRDRVRIQNRIKAELRFYGIELPNGRGYWTGTFVEFLRSIRFNNYWMQAQLRKVTRNRGSFPTADSVRKVIYLALLRISKKWKRPIKDWIAALNHFSIMFEGRI